MDMEEVVVNGSAVPDKHFGLEEIVVGNKPVSCEPTTNGNTDYNHDENGDDLVTDENETHEDGSQEDESIMNGSQEDESIMNGSQDHNEESGDEIHVDVEECRDEDNVPLLKLAAQIKFQVTPEQDNKEEDENDESEKNNENLLDEEEQNKETEVQNDNVSDEEESSESDQVANRVESTEDTIIIPKCLLPTEKFSSVMQDGQDGTETSSQDVTSSKQITDTESSISGSSQSTPEKKPAPVFNYSISGRRPLHNRFTPLRTTAMEDTPRSEPSKLNRSPERKDKSLQKYETKMNLNVNDTPGPSQTLHNVELDLEKVCRKRKLSEEPNCNPDKRIKNNDDTGTSRIINWIKTPITLIKNKLTNDKTEPDLQIDPCEDDKKVGRSCYIM